MKAILFFLFLTLCFSTPLHAEETLLIYADSIAKPKNWQDTNNKAHGIHIEILNEVTKRTGIKFSYYFAPWKRAFESSKSGRGGIIGLSKSKERMTHWDYSVPMYYDEVILVTTKAKAFSFEGIESLKGMRIGVKRGARYGDEFEEAVAKKLFQMVETSDRAGQMQMLTRDRVDAVLLSPGQIALESVIAENSWLTKHRDEFIMLRPPYRLDPNYLGIPKSLNKSYLLPAINKAIKSIFDDGTHEMIVKRATAQAAATLKK